MAERRPVLMYNPTTNEELMYFHSISLAAKVLKVKYTRIRYACERPVTQYVKGFKFRYITITKDGFI